MEALKARLLGGKNKMTNYREDLAEKRRQEAVEATARKGAVEHEKKQNRAKYFKSSRTEELEAKLTASRLMDQDILRVQETFVDNLSDEDAKIVYGILHDRYHGED
jgi:hypothetical protein